MKPLTGVKILSIEQYGAGPFGTQSLADLGAEVIKIEDPAMGGDYARAVGPHFFDSGDKLTDSLFFQAFNRNKKSLSLSLNDTEGRAAFEDLVRSADAVANNLRGDVPEKISIDYNSLSNINSQIVCAHLSGFGRDNERAHWPGYDYLLQAECGYFDLTGEPSGPPARMGLSLVDYMAGLHMALGLVSAVMKARETGQGRDVDVSLADTALYNLSYVGAWQLNAGAEQQRLPRSAHPFLTPCALYKAGDGWIYLMCNKDKFWAILCELIDRPELVADPRFVDFNARFQNRPALQDELDATLSKHTVAHWMALFGGKVPAAPVNSVAQALSEDSFVAKEMVQSLKSESGATVKLLRSPIRTGDDLSDDHLAPKLVD